MNVTARAASLPRARPPVDLVGRSDQAFEAKPPIAREHLAMPLDHDVSPYLQRPLRTLKEALEERKRQQRETVGAGEKRTKRSDLLSQRVTK